MKTTLDQWQVLRTIVEEGGFAQAAEKLHRSQSSVSYAVARLQEQLEVALLRQDGRRMRLTGEGGCCATPTGWNAAREACAGAGSRSSRWRWTACCRPR
ncbi:helix-turn-helix domain-containing protein [Chromobacterium piscinae]|uniref:helix-turn-helix domain-containing protein n=1 Tax=Chromobacterium piscinae TaxID=686831 RepID=UPI003261CD17